MSIGRFPSIRSCVLVANPGVISLHWLTRTDIRRSGICLDECKRRIFQGAVPPWKRDTVGIWPTTSANFPFTSPSTILRDRDDTLLTTEAHGQPSDVINNCMGKMGSAGSFEMLTYSAEPTNPSLFLSGTKALADWLLCISSKQDKMCSEKHSRDDGIPTVCILCLLTMQSAVEFTPAARHVAASGSMTNGRTRLDMK